MTLYLDEKNPSQTYWLYEIVRTVHYEIASYGTLRTFATQASKTDVAKLLNETLQEEEDTDRALTAIAEAVINPKAAQIAERGHP